MSKTGIKTLPLLRGIVEQAVPWGGTITRAGWRVYPYQLGCKVRVDSTTPTIYTYGLGDFAAGDYLIVCQQIFYGNSYFYIPRMNQIGQVSAVSTSDDLLSLTGALDVSQGDYLFNLGADTAATPLIQPNFDGSDYTLYGDNVGGGASLGKYMLTGNQGQYECWLPAGTVVVDMLLTDSSGQPQLVQPFVAVGPEIVE